MVYLVGGRFVVGWSLLVDQGRASPESYCIPMRLCTSVLFREPEGRVVFLFVFFVFLRQKIEIQGLVLVVGLPDCR